MHDKIIYLDCASTTPIHPDIIKDVSTLMKDYYGNADSLHAVGQRVSTLVERSRAAIAKQLVVLPQEVIFTSGGSESNAAAIKGIAFSNPNKKHIITSNVEHSSVEETLKQLETVFGYKVDRLPVNEAGFVPVELLKESLKNDTVLVVMMAMNNEVGSIFPISEYARVIKKHSHAYFHVDAVQAFSKTTLSLRQIDSMAISAHKLGGVKGSGILIKKSEVPFVPLIPGGQQEFGLRGGTVDSVSAIVFSKTMRLALEDHEQNFNKIKVLSEMLWKAFENVEGFRINSPKKGSPYIFNLSIENVGSEIMMNALNAKGIFVSAKSTCNSSSLEPSYVLKAMGCTDEEALCSIRLSLSSKLEIEDLKEVIKTILETKKYVQY